MKIPEGSTKFCDGCPKRQKATGVIVGGLAFDSKSILTDRNNEPKQEIVERSIRLEDQTGEKSLTVQGYPEAFRVQEEDIFAVISAIRKCTSPEIVTESWSEGFGPFKRHYSYKTTVCPAIETYYLEMILNRSGNPK